MRACRGTASLGAMADSENQDPVPERPATWENVVDGEVKHLIGAAIGDKKLAEEGEEEVEIAHEVHDEYEAERDTERPDD